MCWHSLLFSNSSCVLANWIQQCQNPGAAYPPNPLPPNRTTIPICHRPLSLIEPTFPSLNHHAENPHCYQNPHNTINYIEQDNKTSSQKKIRFKPETKTRLSEGFQVSVRQSER
uniref:Uncharacterized protein n=1 Tax=Gossypium raimondii TaxID=29730 RepID=A0A0D2T3S5_GOSRA|nr:hypothetical protein B456_011G070200 [Gossypium raimondii]